MYYPDKRKTMNKTKLKKILAPLAVGLIAAALGYGIGALLAKAAPGDADTPELSAAAVIAAVAPGILLALAWHELGHLLAGLAQGFRFMLFVVGPLGMRAGRTGKVEVYFNTDGALAGGVAATLPRTGTPEVLRKFARVVAAGPLASLLGALLFLPLGYWGLERYTPEAAPYLRWLSWLAMATGGFSVGFFLATVLPGRTGPFFTDRARYFRLIGGGEAALAEQSALELSTQLYGNEPYERMNKAAIDRCLQDDFFRATGLLAATYYHLARKEWAAAHHHASFLPDIAARQPRSFRAPYLEIACFTSAWIARDAEAAREDGVSRRLSAAIAIAEGRLEDARTQLQEARRHQPKEVVSGYDQLEVKLLEEMEAKVR
jgi:hypothetical protein